MLAGNPLTHSNELASGERNADLDRVRIFDWRDQMRFLRLSAGTLGALAVLGVPSVLAPASAAFNDTVTITNKSCTLSYPKVSYSGTVVFGVFNNGTVDHRFFLGGPYATPWIQPNQESTLVTTFRPGSYKWACVSHRKVVARGVFTITP
jgi:hypothetical protein